MIRKSAKRFFEKIMLRQQAEKCSGRCAVMFIPSRQLVAVAGIQTDQGGSQC
jgi:hypothetical protein